MTFLALKMLFRRRGTASGILAVALLVAILAAVNSVVNHINSQASMLSRFTNIGEAYLILSENSTSMIDSRVDARLASLIRDAVDVEYALPQKIFAATLTTKSGNYTALVRGVEDVQSFIDVRRTYVDGVVADDNETQANVGEILARLASINTEDEVNVTVGANILQVKVVGIVKSLTQSDTELVIPMKIANNLYGKENDISFIEFAPKDHNVRNEAISRINELLPADVKVVGVQQLKTFMHDVNRQTLSFIGLWSSAVYAVVVAASYVVATRLITEATSDLAMLRALGAERKLAFKLVLTYTLIVALFGSTMGLAVGITGAQVVSTVVRWVRPYVEVTPFLEVEQAFQVLLSALVASILGCIYPAFKSTYKTSLERSL